MTIKLKTEKSDKLGLIILNLCENINKLKTLKKNEINRIDLSDIDWICPLGILPIATFLSNLENKGYQIKVTLPLNLNIKSYLKTINFFKGINTLDTLRHKNYVPITYISSDPYNIKNRENIETCLGNIILERMDSKTTLANPLKHAISEMLGNVWQHANSKYGWFLAQYYKNKGYVDICILDDGLSIKGSYDASDVANPKNDAEAIELAINGVSTKKDDTRGTGLPSTKNLIINSLLHGKFLLLSGNSGYYENRKNKKRFIIKSYWKGTIILLRLYKIKRKINIYPYIDYL